MIEANSHAKDSNHDQLENQAQGTSIKNSRYLARSQTSLTTNRASEQRRESFAWGRGGSNPSASTRRGCAKPHGAVDLGVHRLDIASAVFSLCSFSHSPTFFPFTHFLILTFTSRQGFRLGTVVLGVCDSIQRLLLPPDPSARFASRGPRDA